MFVFSRNMVLMCRDQIFRTSTSCRSSHYANEALEQLHDANQAFGKSLKPTVYAWHAIISAYASFGQDPIALELFYYLYHQGLLPNRFIFACIAKICAKVGDCEAGKLLHHAIASMALDQEVVVGCALLDMYLRWAYVHDALCVFKTQVNRNVVTWGAMIGGFTQLGQGSVSLGLLVAMQREGIIPDKVICICLVKACGQTGAISQGFLVHTIICECRFDSEVSIINSLVDMYAQFGTLSDALHVFCKQPAKDNVAWGALIKGYIQHGHPNTAFQFLEEMHSSGMQLNEVIVLCVLKASSLTMCLSQCYSIHGLIVEQNFDIIMAIGNSLVDVYAKCGSLDDALRVFEALRFKDMVSWSAMMTGYVRNGKSLCALHFLMKMEKAGIKPDTFLLSCGLKACGIIGAIIEGMSLHHYVLKDGLEPNTVVANALLNMYVICGCLDEARSVFDKLSTRDPITWASMMGGYANNGLSLDSLKLFAEMSGKGIQPSKVSILSVLKACSGIESIEQGKHIHDHLIRCGFEFDITIGNTLLDMYCKCGGLAEAYNVFGHMSDRSVVSWGALIAGYAQHDHGFTAIQLFERMCKNEIEPNRIIFLSTLTACGSIGAIAQGCNVHDLVLRSGCADDVEMRNTLLNMYAKCGFVQEAHKLFQGFESRSDTTWAAMIAAYASYGDTGMVQQLLDDMCGEGVGPNNLVFLSTLAACSHAEETQAGQRMVKAMSEIHGIAPNNDHFTCMIDVLGRAGSLWEGKKILQCMPIASDISGWMALMTSLPDAWQCRAS